MSAYVVNNETISVIAKGFIDYGVDYNDDNGYEKEIMILIDYKRACTPIGQSLLNQNYKSVNYRYREETETPEFEYKQIDADAGMLLGCIKCYIYQACETYDFFESEIYNSLQRLKDKMLERMIERQGMEIPWGI